MRLWWVSYVAVFSVGVGLSGGLVRWRWVRWARRQRQNPWAGRRAREWAQAWRGEP